MDASHGRASQLAKSTLSLVEGLKQGPQDCKSVHQEGRAAGVGLWTMNITGIQMKERETIYSV